MVLSFFLIIPISVHGQNFALAKEDEGVILPILMYHAVLPDDARLFDYSIHLSELRQDLDYIKEAGYTTVLVRDLIDYVENGTPLPNRPILLSFDDGFYSMLSLVLPELELRKQRAVCAVVGRFIEENAEHNDIYGYLDFFDIKELSKSGKVEIANHTKNMHNLYSPRQGVKKRWGESEVSYKAEFQSDINTMQEQLKEFDIFPTTLVYPFGFMDENSDVYAKELGFKASFSCLESVNRITRDSDCLFAMGRFNRAKKSAQTILRGLKY